MKTHDDRADDHALKLLPHQIALVDSFFNPASKRVILLRAEPGLGKTSAFVALAARLLREQPLARALFLVPSALQFQFVEMLERDNVPVLAVDRYRFREMLEAATQNGTWPSGVAVVMSRDLAKQPDIRKSLGEAR